MLFSMEQRQARAIGILLLIVLIGVIWAFLTLRNFRSSQEPPTDGRPAAPASADVDLETVTMEEVAVITAAEPIPPPVTDRWVPPVETLEDGEHIRGDPDAIISIIEYAPIAQRVTSLVHNGLKTFIETDAGSTVSWVWRQYPLEENEEDYLAGQISECVSLVAGNEAFWQFLDLAMASKDFTRDALLSLAGQVRADPGQVAQCLDAKRAWGHMMTDAQSAQLDGKIFIVPAFFIKNHTTGEGRIVEGLHTMDYLKAVVNAVAQGS